MAAVVVCLNTAACINLNTSQLLPVGTPFVVQGTMTLGGPNGDCLVWQADNGQSYYLYQNALLDNNAFDQINTPGVTSRLVIAIRSDLPAGCRADKVAEVNQVLEVLP